MIICMLNPIKLWLQLSLPKLSDNKNLSITVREELIDMLNNVKNNNINIIESQTKYYASRGKLISKCIKYNNDNNYKYAVQSHDNKQLLSITNINIDMRNNLTIIYDMLSKNWQHIIQKEKYNYTDMS